MILKGIAQGLAHYVIWVAISWSVELSFASSSARGAYGMLSAWWASLYIGYITGIGLGAVPFLGVASLIGALLSVNPLTLSSTDSMTWSTDGIVLIVLRFAVLVSPVAVNSGVQLVARWLRQYHTEQQSVAGQRQP